MPHLNGCHNRPALGSSVVPIQDGWFMDGVTRAPRMKALRFALSPECQYTDSPAGLVDRGCDGCRWRRLPQPVAA